MEELIKVNSACKKSGITHLIRAHPSQSRDEIDSFVKQTSNCESVHSTSLDKLLVEADLIVSRSSTVGLEAAYLRRPVVQVDPQIHKDMPLQDLGLAVGATYANIKEAIDFAISDKYTFSSHDRILPITNASKNVAHLILSLNTD